MCKYTVHERCVARAAQNCIETYSKSGHAMPCVRMKHHWVRTQLLTVKGTVNFQVAGNCLGKCDHCRHSVKMHNGMHCRWCQTTVSLFEDFISEELLLGTYTLHATDRVRIAWNSCVSSAAAHCSRSIRPATGQCLLKPTRLHMKTTLQRAQYEGGVANELPASGVQSFQVGL